MNEWIKEQEHYNLLIQFLCAIALNAGNRMQNFYYVNLRLMMLGVAECCLFVLGDPSKMY